MAKRRRRSKAGSRSQRGYHYNTRKDLLRPSAWKEPLDDRRRWHPDGLKRHPRDIYHIDIETEIDERNRFDQNRYDKLKFEQPWKVPICRRRKRRRETLFALRRIGKGKGSGAERKRNLWSDVRC